jgi:hypothetical protein
LDAADGVDEATTGLVVSALGSCAAVAALRQPSESPGGRF